MTRVSVMANVEVVLDGGVAGPGVDPLRPGLAVTCGEPERAGAADHGPSSGQTRPPGWARDGEAAAVIGTAAHERTLLENGLLVPVTGRISAGPCGRH